MDLNSVSTPKNSRENNPRSFVFTGIRTYAMGLSGVRASHRTTGFRCVDNVPWTAAYIHRQLHLPELTSVAPAQGPCAAVRGSATAHEYEERFAASSNGGRSVRADLHPPMGVQDPASTRTEPVTPSAPSNPTFPTRIVEDQR